jgi:hypothetical protein
LIQEASAEVQIRINELDDDTREMLNECSNKRSDFLSNAKPDNAYVK